MPPRPRAHAHGADDDEDEAPGPRIDGPPFVDLVAKQGQGFTSDYSSLQHAIGPQRLALADYLRDVETINRVYVPVAHRSYKYMRYGTGGMLAGLVMFIIMGIIGGTPDVRAVVIPVCLFIFVVGLASFLYSKWVEQGTIKEGAAAVKRVIDEEINPQYTEHPSKIRYTVGVHARELKTFHLGRTLLARPVVTIWVLYSPNAQGVMTNWSLPAAIERADSITIRRSMTSIRKLTSDPGPA